MARALSPVLLQLRESTGAGARVTAPARGQSLASEALWEADVADERSVAAVDRWVRCPAVLRRLAKRFQEWYMLVCARNPAVRLSGIFLVEKVVHS